MILSKMTNLVDNSTSILYYDKNIKSFSGIKIMADGKVIEDKTLINQIFDIIKFNNSCTFMKSENGYDIYLNPSTGYKHYLKDGKEDFMMFYKENGMDASCYSRKDNAKRKGLCSCKNFIRLSCVFSISFLAFFICANGLEKDEVFALIENTAQYGMSKLSNKDLNDEKLSAEEANKLIEDSMYLDENTKKYLINEQLFKDLMPYLNDSYTGYMLSDKLSLLKLGDMESYINEKETFRYVSGSYSMANPFRINVDMSLEEEDCNHVKSHEFIHFLQNSPFLYLLESSAELINIEYYNEKYIYEDMYANGIRNLKLLIQTVGKEPILKCVFSGDSSELRDILKDNLNPTEYAEFISILFSSPRESLEKNERLQQLISILYNNIYNENMFDNPAIMYELSPESFDLTNSSSIDIGIFYFNSSKKKDEYDFKMHVEAAHILGYVQTENIYRKKISYKEYLEKNSEEWCTFELASDIEIKNGKIYAKKKGPYTIEQAEEKGLITFYQCAYEGHLDNTEGWSTTEFEYVLDENRLNGKLYTEKVDKNTYRYKFSFSTPSYEQRIEEAKNQKKLVK